MCTDSQVLVSDYVIYILYHKFVEICRSMFYVLFFPASPFYLESLMDILHEVSFFKGTRHQYFAVCFELVEGEVLGEKVFYKIRSLNIML